MKLLLVSNEINKKIKINININIVLHIAAINTVHSTYSTKSFIEKPNEHAQKNRTFEKK